MTTPPEPDGPDRADPDVPRRTWLAAERTWLAWWRTGLGVTAVAIAVGRLLPTATSGAKWPFRLLGLGYGLLAVVVLVLGAVRQRQVVEAMRRGSYDQLSTPLVMWLTAGAVLLATGTLALVAVSF